jgi:hypothetical protein
MVELELPAPAYLRSSGVGLEGGTPREGRFTGRPAPADGGR